MEKKRKVCAQKSLEYRFKEIYIDLCVCAILIELGNGNSNRPRQKRKQKYSNKFYECKRSICAWNVRNCERTQFYTAISSYTFWACVCVSILLLYVMRLYWMYMHIWTWCRTNDAIDKPMPMRMRKQQKKPAAAEYYMWFVEGNKMVIKEYTLLKNTGMLLSRSPLLLRRKYIWMHFIRTIETFVIDLKLCWSDAFPRCITRFLSTWKVDFCGNGIPRIDVICGCEVEMLFGLQQFLHLIGCIFIVSRRLWILLWNAVYSLVHLLTRIQMQ